MPDKRESKLRAALKRSRTVQRVRKAAKGRAWKAYLERRAAFRRRRAITATRAQRLRAYQKSLEAGPKGAVQWAAGQVGTTESPPGSNRGPKITGWQESWGSWLVGQPWCGVFVGVALRDHGGVKGLTSRVAGVALIEDDAIAGRNGFKSWHGPQGGQPGDAVVLFGRGVHVELIAAKHSWGYETVGGNTSPENSSGSQSNGGGCFRRKRPFSVVRGCARPNY